MLSIFKDGYYSLIVIFIQAHQLKSLEMFLFERNASQSDEWAFNYLVKSVSGTFLATLLYLFTLFFILGRIHWPWTWQTSVFDPVCVINDDLTLNWTCRGAGLMYKHIRSQQWSPCFRPGCVSDRVAALCVPACLWTAAAENKNFIPMWSLFFPPLWVFRESRFTILLLFLVFCKILYLQDLVILPVYYLITLQYTVSTQICSTILF